jgi:hypothetical protein
MCCGAAVERTKDQGERKKDKGIMEVWNDGFKNQ